MLQNVLNFAEEGYKYILNFAEEVYKEQNRRRLHPLGVGLYLFFLQVEVIC